MPDLETLATVLDIIRRVPHAHVQGGYVGRLRDDEQGLVQQELESAPDLAPVVPCGTGLCVGGWALLVKGYGLNWEPYFTYPLGYVLNGEQVGGQRLRGAVGYEAATMLGLDYDEAMGMDHGHGIFLGSNTLADIEDWIAYYRGELDAEELYARLELRAAERLELWAAER